MLDPKALTAEEKEKALSIGIAVENQCDARIADVACSLDVRKDVAKAYMKQLRGMPLTDAEIALISYFQAGLLVE